MIKLKIVLCALVMAVASGLSSCSVKEDRSACPCRLVMDFDGTDTLAVACRKFMQVRVNRRKIVTT